MGNYLKNFLIICLGSFILFGCYPKGLEKYNKEVDKQIKDIQVVKEKKEQDFGHKKVVQLKDEPYIDVYNKMVLNERKYPKVFYEDIVLISRPMYLPEILDKVTKLTGIPTSLSVTLKGDSNKSGESSVSDDKKELLKQMTINYNGKLINFLDVISAYYGIYWEYKDGVITFYKYKTKTFILSTVGGKVKFSALISNQSSSNSGSSSGQSTSSQETRDNIETETSDEFFLWDDIIKDIDKMLSPGGKVSFNRGAGIITVIDTPTVLSEVGEYINQVNERLSKQVAIIVEVYSLDLNDSQEFAFSPTLIFQELDKRFKIGLQAVNPVSLSTGIGEVSAMILDTSAGGDTATSKQWGGTQALLKALKTKGKVSLITSGSGLTLNNQPFPLQNISRVSYLASVSSESTDSSTTVELNPGEVSTGFAMTVIPHILNNNKVILHYNVSLSTLDNIKEIESGSQKIQAPEVSVRSFMQRVALKLGSTLILAGFQQSKNEYNKGSGLEGILGYGATGKKKQSLIIIAITVNKVDGV